MKHRKKAKKNNRWYLGAVFIILLLILLSFLRSNMQPKTINIVKKSGYIKLFSQGTYYANGQSKLRVRLVDLHVDDPSVKDGLAQAVVKVRNVNLQEKEILFRVGGFAGFKQTRGSAFGYTFDLDRIDSNGVKLYYFEE